MTAKRTSVHRPEPRHLPTILALLGLGLLVRLVFLWEGSNDPFHDFLILDGRVYHLLAAEIAQQNFWGSEVFFRAPLFPYLLGLTYLVFGLGTWAIRIVHLLLGLGTIFCTYEVARLKFSAKLARLAGIVTALYPTLYFFESELMPTTLTVFTCMLSLYQLALYEKSARRRHLILAGISLGLAALARPVILVFALLLIFWLRSIGGRRSWKRAIGRYAMVLGAMLIVILPVTVRNYIIEPDFVLISSQGGANLFIGNNRYADGLTVAFPNSAGALNKYEDHIWSDSRDLAQRELRRELSAAEISTHWQGKGLDYISSNPTAAAGLFFSKVYYFFCGEELFNNKNPLAARQYAHVYSLLIWDYGLSFPYGLLAPLLLVGTVVLLRSKEKHWLLLLFIYSQVLATSLFFVCSRFRQPAIPAMIIVALAGLYYLYGLARKRKWRPALPYLVGLLILLVGLNPPGRVGSEKNLSMYNTTLAGVLEKQGENELAISLLEEALSIAPDNVSAWTYLGTVNAKIGRFDQAAVALTRAERLSPSDMRPVVLLARVYYDKGDFSQALSYLERVLAAGGRDDRFLMMAARSAVNMQRPDRAGDYLRTLLDRNPAHTEGRRLLDSLTGP